MKNPKQAPVLCVQRQALPEHLRISHTALVPMHINDLEYKQVSFINRAVVDAKREVNTAHFSIGVMFPQILPYVVLVSDRHVLMYNRKGNETRLHGKASIGIGGHIDVEDSICFHDQGEAVLDVAATIIKSCERELHEEAGITQVFMPDLNFNHALISVDDEVGQVHLGLIAIAEIDPVYVHPQEELRNARWVPISDLRGMIGECENWSQILINNLEGLQYGND